MPEQWMYDGLGEEARPRPGFEDELARELQRGWQGRRTPWRAVAWGAAAATLLIGVVTVVMTNDTKKVAPADSTAPINLDTAAPPTSASRASAAHIAIGDSVMIAAEQLLSEAGIVVNARESRGPQGVIAAINDAVEIGTIGDGSVVLIHIGSSAPLSDTELGDILDSIPTDVGRIVFMTLAAPVEWISTNNDLIRSLPTLDPRVVVADWAAASTEVALCPDGIHVSCSREATTYYAAFVLEALGITSTTSATTSTTPEPNSGVRTYLSALATGDYTTAAQLLIEGSLSPEHRADTRPLFRPEFGLVPGQTDRDAVAAALEMWCSVALCVQPTEVADLPDGWWTRAVFPAPGGAVVGLFADYELEGRSGVTGLPPLAPDAADTAPIVACPSENVRYVAWADLDGDGRLEQLVGRSVGDAGWPEDGVEDYVIDTCGTTLQVEPFELTGDGLAIYPVNPLTSGADRLLIGFLEGYATGGVYTFDGERLVQVEGPDGPASFALAPFIAALPEAETFGCVVMTEGRPPVMANLQYRLVGGNDLSNSTSMELTTVDVITGASMSTTFDLPEQAAEASEALNGRCNGLSVQTG